MQLQKPGAGLPKLERLFIKNILAPTSSKLFTWNSALHMYKREIKIIKKLVESVPKEVLTHKTIIDRTFAIEDHSRQFSVNMVLEHLTIVGFGIMSVIDTLSQEKEFPRDITIEGVKPFENKENALDDLLAFSDTYEKFIKNHPKKISLARKSHPWFYALNNFEWSVFIFMHTRIHRKQIQAIISQLKKENVF